jgi:hypothetical protein
MKKIILTLAIMISSTIGMNAQSFVIGANGCNGGAVLVVNERGIYINGGLRSNYPEYSMRPSRVRMARPGFTIGTVTNVVVPSGRYYAVSGRSCDRYAMARERCLNQNRYSSYDNRYSNDRRAYSYNNRDYSYNNRDYSYNNRDYSYNDDCDEYDNDNYCNTRYGNNSSDDRVDFDK